MRSGKIIDLRGKRLERPQPRLALAPGGKRKPSLRAKRRKVRAYVALGALCTLGAAAYGVSWVSYLPQFTVQDVEVRQAASIPASLVERYVESILYDGSSAFLSTRNILLYPRQAIESSIPQFFPRIRSATVARESLLGTVAVVTVEEREAFARWCASATLEAEGAEECFLMDADGFIFAEAASGAPAASAYVFRGELDASPIGKTYLSGRFAGVRALLTKLGQAGFDAREVALETEKDFSVLLAGGFSLRAAFGSDVGALVENLQLVFASPALRGKENELEYVDLRFGNRVYFKLKGGEQQASE